MAVGRTLTKRSRHHSSSSDPRRQVEKTKISAPVQLLSTTNMLSYTAPDLRPSYSHGSLTSSSGSSTSSPTSSSFPNSPLSPATSDDGSLRDIDCVMEVLPSRLSPPPLRPRSSNPHLPAHRRTPSGSSLSRTPSRKGLVLPPKALHSALQLPRQSQHTTSHPFETELAQVAEMTEEMGVSVRDAEEEFMVSHGLQKWGAVDYEVEIWSGVGNVFEDVMPGLGSAGWI